MLADKINKGFEFGNYSCLTLIYWQKTFDTIDHDIRLKKLWGIGLLEKVISGIES